MAKGKKAHNEIRVGALVPYPVYPAKMGGQKGIALFYEYLSERLPVTVISTSDNEFPSHNRVSFEPALGTSRLRYINLFLFFRLRRLIRDKGITHLVAEHPYYAWLVMLLKWSAGVRLIAHSHNIESLRFRSTGKWWWGVLWHYEKWFHRLADENFFVTDEDRNYAVRTFGVRPERCHTATYGMELSGIPDPGLQRHASETIRRLHGIKREETLLLFNGTLDYAPNSNALEAIIREISPRLSKKGFEHKVLVCGKNLPERFGSRQGGKLAENVIYTGFVDDINQYFLGSDIFLNPVSDGGGIKTKLVEALGLNLCSVSTRNGAIGVPEGLVPGKMTVVNDGDWEAFADAVCSVNLRENTPPAFFNHFYWGNIADKVVHILKN